MGGLPAIPQLRPFQNVDPLEQVGKALSIRDLQQRQQLNQGQMQLQQQQIQEGQLQLAQREALNKAYQGAVTMGPDGKPTFDQNKVFQSISASGQGSLIPGLTKTFMDLDEQKGKIQKAQDEHVQAAQEYMGHIGKIIQQSKYDPTIAGTLFARAAADGYGQQAQQVLGHLNQNPQDLKQIADEMVQGSSGQTKEALEAQQTAEAAQKTKQSAADTLKAELENQAMQGAGGGNQQMADMKYRALQQKKALKQPLSTDDKAFIAGYEKQKLLVPVASANIRMEGMGKIRQFPVYDSQTKQTVYMDSNEINDAKLREPGRYTVPNFTAGSLIQQQTGKAFGPGGKASEEVLAFNTALSHADLLETAAKALQNGDVKQLNRARLKIQSELGSPVAPTFQAIANAYSREVTKALSAGHITDSEIAQQGGTLPANASPQQIIGVLGAYKGLMQSKVNLRKAQFEQGTQGQPNFGGTSNQPASQVAAPPANLLKEGVHTTFKNGQTWTKQNGQAVQVK